MAERGGDRGGFGRGFGGRGCGGDRGGRGRLVRDGKIKSLEKIYLHSLPIKEHQIIDTLVGPSLKDEVMKIMSVQKQTRAGQRTRFKAFVVVGPLFDVVVPHPCTAVVPCSMPPSDSSRTSTVAAPVAPSPVRAEKLWIEIDSIEKGIVQLISEHGIKWLGMGAAANKSYSRKMKEPKSKKAIHVCKAAPSFCHIWFMCKGNLVYTSSKRKHPLEIKSMKCGWSGLNASSVKFN
ncbi:hypothetical protein ACS0TY_014092 [Phlomoides rotata]